MNQRAWQNLLHFLPHQGQLKNIGLLAGSTAIGQLILIIASPIISRLYSQVDLGIFGLISAFSSVASVFVTLKYELAIVSAESEREALDLMAFSLLITFFLAIVSCCGLAFLIHFNFYNFGAVSYFSIPIAFLQVCVISASGIFRYWFTRNENFELIGKISLWQGFGRGISQIALFSFASSGLLLGETLGRSLGLSLSWSQSKVNSHIRKILTQEISVKSTLQRYRSFPTYVLPSSIIDILSVMLPLPIIAGLYGRESAGLYALAQRVIAIPLSLIGSSVADVFHSQIANLQRSERQKTLSAFWLMTRSLILVGILPAIILGVWGKPIFEIVFGNKWGQSGTMAALMTPWMLAQFVVSPISRLILVSEKQGFKLFYDVIAFSIVIIVPHVIHRSNGTVFDALFWLSISKTIAYGLYFWIVWLQARYMSR